VSRKRLSQVPLYRNGVNDDAELMSKVEIAERRVQGEMMHRYGASYLWSSVIDGMPYVSTGNPNQVIKLSE